MVLYGRINGIRITTADELQAAMVTTDATMGAASRLLDLCIGRFYAVVKWPLLEFLMRDCSDHLLSTIRIATFFLCAISATKFVRDALEDGKSAACFLILVCALLPVVVTYQPLFYNPMLWVGWASVWLMGVIALRAESKLNRGFVVGLFGLAMISHEMNAVFVIWPWLVRGLVAGKGFRQGLTPQTILCGVVLLAYAAIALSIRLYTAKFGITYSGGTIAFDGVAAATALVTNSLGCLPGLELWLSPRWQGIEGPLFIGPKSFLIRLQSHLDLADYALACGVGILTWLFLRSNKSVPSGAPPRRRPPLLWALTFMVFAPNLLLSLTKKYQAWTYERMWPYYYSWMSYLALVMILVVVLDRIRDAPGGKKTLAFAIALAVALLAAVSAATSRESTDFFREYRFDHSKVPAIRQ